MTGDSERGRWSQTTKKTPAIPKLDGELHWIEARIQQVQAAEDILHFEVVRIVGSQGLIDLLQTQYKNDDSFRLRWSETKFVFMPSYWELEGDDSHWYSLGLQTKDMNFFEVDGLAYPTPMPESHVELRWTFWMDGMSPKEAEEAARKLHS